MTLMPLAPGAHGTAHGVLHGAAEADALLQLLGDVLGHQLSVGVDCVASTSTMLQLDVGLPIIFSTC